MNITSCAQAVPVDVSEGGPLTAVGPIGYLLLLGRHDRRTSRRSRRSVEPLRRTSHEASECHPPTKNAFETTRKRAEVIQLMERDLVIDVTNPGPIKNGDAVRDIQPERLG